MTMFSDYSNLESIADMPPWSTFSAIGTSMQDKLGSGFPDTLGSGSYVFEKRSYGVFNTPNYIYSITRTNGSEKWVGYTIASSIDTITWKKVLDEDTINNTINSTFENTITYRKKLTDADDLNDLKEPGIWYVSGTVPDSWPVEVSGTSTGVILEYGTKSDTPANKAQFVIAPEGTMNRIYFRSGTINGWGSWKTNAIIDDVTDMKDYTNSLFNWMDLSTKTTLDAFITNGVIRTGSQYTTKLFYIPIESSINVQVLKPVSSSRFIVGWTETVPAAGVVLGGSIQDNSATTLTITTGAKAKYLVVYYCYNDTTWEECENSITVCVGTKSGKNDGWATSNKYIAFGTSLTNRQSKNASFNYPAVFGNYMHFDWTNAGLGGKGLLHDWNEVVAQVDALSDEYALITTMWGGNDGAKMNELPLGSYTDTFSGTPSSVNDFTTVMQAHYWYTKHLIEQCPSAMIIVCTGFGHWTSIESGVSGMDFVYDGGDTPFTYGDFCDELEKMCQKYGIACINLHKQNWVNDFNYGTLLQSDKVHPTEPYGYMQWSRFMCGKLSALYMNRAQQ